GDLTGVEKTQTEIVGVENALAGIRAQAGGQARDRRIAELLHLSEYEVDLLWSVVAATIDPALSPHIRDLAGGEARHGITVALHAIMAGLDHHAARGLALGLTPLHPLLRYGVLETTMDAVPAARAMSVPLRVATFLAGNDTIDQAVLRCGGVIRVDEEPHFDD